MLLSFFTKQYTCLHETYDTSTIIYFLRLPLGQYKEEWISDKSLNLLKVKYSEIHIYISEYVEKINNNKYGLTGLVQSETTATSEYGGS